MKRAFFLLPVALLALFCSSCRTNPPAAVDPVPDCVPLAEMPDPLRYLPDPPADDSPGKAYDLACHEAAKKLRETDPARAEQAVRDAGWGFDTFYAVFSPAFGRTISEEETPALCAMVRFGLRTARHSYRAVKNARMRLRPFAELGESSMTPEGDEGLAKSSSYPSGHAANGWALALLLAEVRPSRAEALFGRGLAYGDSRVIVGVHWRSDVVAGRVAGAAAVARLHADPRFRALMDAARAECGERLPLLSRENVPREEMPDGLLYLPPPPAEGTPAKAFDEARYEWGKAERVRDPARAERAVKDAVFTCENVYDMFSEAFGRTISEEETPALCAMLRFGCDTVRHGGSKVKRHYMRTRPFVQHGEPTLLPDDEKFLRDNGSYPSGHAANGWGCALLLAEVRPSRAAELFARGLSIGDSRVIAGVHWQSDVDAARLVAAAAVARLHAEPDFAALLAAARAECGD